MYNPLTLKTKIYNSPPDITNQWDIIPSAFAGGMWGANSEIFENFISKALHMSESNAVGLLTMAAILGTFSDHSEGGHERTPDRIVRNIGVASLGALCARLSDGNPIGLSEIIGITVIGGAAAIVGELNRRTCGIEY